MSRKANPYDNAIMESFFATLKTECFQNQIPKSRREAKLILFDYIETFYNRSRLHSALRTNHHWNSKTNSTSTTKQKLESPVHVFEERSELTAPMLRTPHLSPLPLARGEARRTSESRLPVESPRR